MRGPSIRFFVAWLCLFSFGLDMAVHALGSVVCISEGGVRLEWSCEKDERGACLAVKHAVDGTGDHARDGRDPPQATPAPCRHLPVNDDHDQAHHLLVQAKQHGHGEFTFLPVTIAVLPPRMFYPLVRHVRAGPETIARPPDALGRLAAIVMIV